VDPVSEKVYRRVLDHKIFTKLRKDHCMCTTCLRSGWRGIWDHGRKLITMMDSCNNWKVHIDEDGNQQRHVPGTHLLPRLKRLWDFIRLEKHLHVDISSEIGSHCCQLNLGSLADDRLNNPCRHDKVSDGPPVVPIDSAARCTSCPKKSKHHCKHCNTSFCRNHCEGNICTTECLPQKFGKFFVCTSCSPKVEAKTHKEGGCATCDEVHFFKLDIMKAALATGSSDILGRAENLCASIDTMTAHIMRTSNQVVA